MRLRRGTIAFLLTACLTAPAGAAAKPPAGFAGILSEDTYVGSDAYQATTLKTMRATGFNLIRQTFNWGDIQPRPDVIDFSATDRFVLAATKQRIRVLPILFGQPDWAVTKTGGPHTSATTSYPPNDPQTLAAFGAAVAQRYGTGGTLWTEHPTVKPLPTTAYQVWNEQNLRVYWGGRPSAAAYVNLLKPVATAIRGVQPRAEIVTGGMPQSKSGIALTSYIRGLYRRGAGPYIDTVAVNAYSANAARMLQRLRAVRRIMNRGGARGDRMRVTEFGWADTGPKAKPYTVGPKKQASLISSTVRALHRARRGLKLRGFVYSNWRDLPIYQGGKDFYGLHTGLLKKNGARKRALAAMKRALKLSHTRPGKRA